MLRPICNDINWPEVKRRKIEFSNQSHRSFEEERKKNLTSILETEEIMNKKNFHFNTTMHLKNIQTCCIKKVQDINGGLFLQRG